MPVTPNGHLCLHEFLRNEHEAILAEWERLDRQSLASASQLSRKDLLNNIPDILNDMANIAESAEADAYEIDIPKEGPEGHAQQRWTLGFSLEEVTREFGFLRIVILQKLVLRIGELRAGELVLLNEALDHAIIQSVVTFVSKSNKALETEREHLQATLRSISDGVISSDVEGRITYFNPAAERLTGWSCDEALGHPVAEVLVVVRDISSRTLRKPAPEDKLHPHATEMLLQQRNGDMLPVEVIAVNLSDAHGENLGILTTVRDMSTIRALTTKLGYQASHDPLTGLPNRTFLREQLENELACAERDDTRLALLYLDLDMFKDVNDMLGHSVGDELLREVAKRLEHGVRESDTVCRLGGDEFLVLLVDFKPLSYLGELGEKLARHLRAPFVLGPDTVELSTSIGISVFPEDGRDAETLIKHADTAMYHAKACGRNNVQFFSPEMTLRASERYELESDLRKAIGRHQLSLYFQPQISLRSGGIIGAEVLLRWHHPTRGLIPPSRFIPVAEQSGNLMLSIGDWVLEQACQQARAWRDAGKGSLRLSVNVSMSQLRNDSFHQHVEKLLKQFQLSPDQLQLEMTESIIMSDVAGAKEHIRQLKNLGVQIAVDDFGTGYSSLSYLKDLPVDELKIDQSFLRNIGQDTDNAAIVKAVIAMGQSLNLRVIAEGVEGQAAVDFLTTNDCEAAQGYFYSEAVNSAAFERDFLRRQA